MEPLYWQNVFLIYYDKISDTLHKMKIQLLDGTKIVTVDYNLLIFLKLYKNIYISIYKGLIDASGL